MVLCKLQVVARLALRVAGLSEREQLLDVLQIVEADILVVEVCHVPEPGRVSETACSRGTFAARL